jgi:four helix bundle protein
MSAFRFENLEVWQLACDIGDTLCTLADTLQEKHLYGFADQLRRAALSMSNNIAEGSGSRSNKDFQNFLNHSRRSVYECASMMLFFQRKSYVERAVCEETVCSLANLSKKIYSFSQSLS